MSYDVTLKKGDVINVDTPLGRLSLTVDFVPKDVPDPDPQPDPQPVDKLHAVYYMMWSTSGSPKFADLSPKFNEIRLAFAQTSYDPNKKRKALRLVGTGSQDLETLKAGIQARRRRGDRVLISIGGQHGSVEIGDVVAFVQDIKDIDALLGGVDGIDWDVEASALDGEKVFAVNSAISKTFPKWTISFVPNGTNVEQYLPVAVRCVKAGMNVIYGQQFYDAVVPLGDARWRIKQAIDAEIPAERIYVGMMNPDPRDAPGMGSKRWTVEQCVANMGALLGEFNLLGAALWESGRKDTPRYADAVANVMSSAA